MTATGEEGGGGGLRMGRGDVRGHEGGGIKADLVNEAYGSTSSEVAIKVVFVACAQSRRCLSRRREVRTRRRRRTQDTPIPNTDSKIVNTGKIYVAAR